jgi:Zn-dependent metalloprotease
LRAFIIILSILSVSSVFAASGSETLPGTVVKAGYDQQSPLFINSLGSDKARQLKDRFTASYAAENDQIPSQIIIVAPKSGSTGYGLIDGTNIENAARNYLSSSGVIASSVNLILISKKFVLNKIWFVNFRREIGGYQIEDEGMGLAITPAGEVSFFWGTFDSEPAMPQTFSLSRQVASDMAARDLDGTITQSNYIGQVILPLYFNGRIEYHPTYKLMIVTSDPYAEWETYVDAQNGQILKRTNKVYYDEISGNIGGSIQPLYPYNSWQDRVFYYQNLTFAGYDPITTDSLGNYSFELPNSNPIDVDMFLNGPFLNVINDAGSNAELTETVTPPTANLYWDDSNSSGPERDAWYSANNAHRWIKALDPDLSAIDFSMNCHVNVAGTCNAYWASWDRSVNFYHAGGGCSNIAQIADVVYHEYGHGITDMQTRPLGPSGAMHEGFSDYNACTITNQPRVGVGFYAGNPNEALRTLDNNNRYPDDINGEVHNDGLIISGAIWHTRQALSPYSMGYTDSLWHYARYAQTQAFEPYFWAFVAEDDNDGNLSNGTPNAAVIFHNFGDRHGIGPGTTLFITADTLLDSEDTTRTYQISASISAVFDLLPDSVLLYYDNGSGFNTLRMNNNGGSWIGTIPAQRNNTHLNYYILAVDRGGFRGTWPVGAPENHYSFFIGPDIIPPRITMVQSPVNTINLLGPYGPFTITASDINEIDPTMVRLHYRINYEPEYVVALTPTANPNEYSLAALDLSRYLFTGDTIFYYFTAVDGARMPNTGRLPTSGWLNFTMVTSELFEIFDGHGLENWIAGDGWNLRDEGYDRYSVWFSSPNYPNNANSSLTMNFDYDLSRYLGASVRFAHKNIIQPGDTCFVEASNNGGFNWNTVGAITGSQVPFYQTTECSIASVLNPSQHHYKVRFRFVSDSSGTSVGVFLDSIAWVVSPFRDAIDDSKGQLPRELELSQNYPNPFNPETNILFVLPQRSDVKLEVFDILGRSVAILIDRPMDAGNYSIIWNGKDSQGQAVASGVYLYRLTTGQGVRLEKMTLLR